MLTDLRCAAINLRLKLWPRSRTEKFPPGCIGIGEAEQKLIVYLQADRHPQHEEPFFEFHGFPVVWHYMDEAITGHSFTSIIIDDPLAKEPV